LLASAYLYAFSFLLITPYLKNYAFL
jgi:hypothetical protein